MPHPAQSPYSELLNISEVATPSEISFDAPAYEPPSARLQRGLDDLACAQQTARAVKATPVMPRLYPRDAEPGALLATGKERVPSSSGPLLMRFGHSRGFLLKFSLSSVESCDYWRVFSKKLDIALIDAIQFLQSNESWTSSGRTSSST